MVDVLAMTGLLLWVPQARLGLSCHSRPKAVAATSGTTPQIPTVGAAILDIRCLIRPQPQTSSVATTNWPIFERAVAAARQGAPAVLLVGGEAGIGKSTLVTEGARRAAAELIVGRCLPMGGELIPLAPLAELLRNVRRTNPAALSEPALAPLRDWIGARPGGPTAGGWRAVRAAARARRRPRC